MKKYVGPGGLIPSTAHLTNVTYGQYCEIGEYNWIENTHFEDMSYTGQFCFLQNVQVGRFANIAAMVRIGATNHPYERPSLHHFTYRTSLYGWADQDDQAFFDKRVSQVTEIGEDTWIGHGSIILPNLSVSRGAIVAAGSVVTKDVPPYAIVAGVPAKVVKSRYPKDVIAGMEATQWWAWDLEVIRDRLEDFRGSAEDFIAKYRP